MVTGGGFPMIPHLVHLATPKMQFAGNQGDDDMSNRLKLAVLAGALAGGVALGPVVYAQSTQGTPPQGGMPDSGMMQGGDMTGMMNMMTQATQMMETCNKTMQSAMQSPNQPRNAPGESVPVPQEQGG